MVDFTGKSPIKKRFENFIHYILRVVLWAAFFSWRIFHFRKDAIH